MKKTEQNSQSELSKLLDLQDKPPLSEQQLKSLDSPYMPLETSVRRTFGRFKRPENGAPRVEGDGFIFHDDRFLNADELAQDLLNESEEKYTSRVFVINIAPHEYQLENSCFAQDSFKQMIRHFGIPSGFLVVLSPDAIPPSRSSWRDQRQTNVFHEWISVPTPISHEFLRDRRRQCSPDDEAVVYNTLPMSLYIRRDMKRRTCMAIAINFIGIDCDKYIKHIEEYLRIDARTTRKGQRFLSFSSYLLIHLEALIPRWVEALKNIDGSLSFDDSRLQTRSGDRFASLSERYAQADEVREHLYSTAAILRKYRTSMTPLIERGHFSSTHTFKVEEIESFHGQMVTKAAELIELATERTRILNEQQMVANGEAMQKALAAMQQEAETTRVIAEQSSLLSQEMRRDSAAMRTIAVMTLFFLPGTAFAALLSMPFFEAEPWLNDITKLWLWIALTVPSTGLAFCFYWYIRGRELRRAQIDRPNDLAANRHQDLESLNQLLDTDRDK